MSRMKKIIIGIIIGLISILGFYTTSSAYYVGQRVTINGSDYYNGNTDIFCIEHNQKFKSINTMRVVSQIKIVGNKSTDYKGITQTSTANARLAYILSQNNNSVNKADGQVQNAIWNYMYTWMNQVGCRHWRKNPDGTESLFGRSFASSTQGHGVALDQWAANYAANYEDMTENMTDNTNKTKITVGTYEKNGKSYIRVGPFNWSFSGAMESVTAYDQNGNPIGGILYSRFNGNTETWVEAKQIVSGSNFYISVPTNSGVSKITKITGKANVNVLSVNIWFLEPWTDQTRQNLIIREPGSDSVPIETSFDYDIPMPGKLKVIKVDKDNHTIKLEGVGFYIQHRDTGKYVKRISDGTISYVEKANATKFVTDKNGEILIENLIVGTYVAYETENPNYGYVVVEEEQQKEVVVDKTSELVIENKLVTGNLKVIKVDKDDHTIKLKGVGFYIQQKDTGKYVKQNPDGTISYVEKANATEFVTDENGEILIENLIVGTYVAYETKNPNYGYLIIEKGQEVEVVIDKTSENPIENKLATGNLKVIKVNEDNTIIRLPGVGFYIEQKDTGRYVKQSSDGTISYVEKADATEFVTDENGEILLEKLIVGTYVAYETKNPNYGYEIISEGEEQTVIIDKTAELQIGNKQVYVKLSGYVWVDKIAGKTTDRNDLYKDSNNDPFDVLLDGIKVRLKDRETGETVKETTTANGGSYLFIDVLIEKLGDYYIEFEYDGLTYTNVEPHLYQEDGVTDKPNGSKSAEGEVIRDEFNQNFSVVEGESRDTGYTRDANGNRKHTLSYNINEAEHEATLINNGQYTITANTDVPNYIIKDHFTSGQEEIKYINLGLYERETPDLAVVKDLQNVRLTINGYEHTYIYSQRFLNKGEYGDGFNVGVKFGSKYGSMSYSRAIYKSDYEYSNEKDKSKELKVYVTYQIGIRNQSSNLTAKVNNMVDYYDSKYEIVNIGTSLDEKGNVVGNISHTETSYNDDYSKTIIDNGTTIKAQGEENIYVQFALNREAVINILNDRENLNNVVEINSYSIYDGDKIYAGIDMDSNPGNCVPGDTRTYEDDTDSSPALKLEVADQREMTGKVFLDETSGELMAGQVRQGSGAYEDGEAGIEGVELTLTENTGSEKVYTATTDANGDFLISDYIPGDYTLTYTWGDETYTVQNYKGTIYDSTRDQNNKKWYKENVETRLTDAIDDYDTRLKIDEELKNMTSETQTTIDKMNSTTPTMGIGVEYETTYTASLGDRYVYRIENVDFGIVERPRQDLALSKRVKTLKATLPDGIDIANLTIDENGNITGDRNSVAYMGPSVDSNGFIKLELDNEIIQGSIIEVGYEIKATNRSELDYLSEKFYKYGIVEGNVVTIEPTAVIDYLDNKWAFDGDKNSQWKVKTTDELKTLVAEEVYNNTESTVADKTILYTESLKGQKLQPTQSSQVILLDVAKTLATTDEIALDNETEIIELSKTGGSMPQSIPGNYIPGKGRTETDDDMAETTIVTPNTGDNQNYLVPVMIGTTALIILGVGVIIIKKKVL